MVDRHVPVVIDRLRTRSSTAASSSSSPPGAFSPSTTTRCSWGRPAPARVISRKPSYDNHKCCRSCARATIPKRRARGNRLGHRGGARHSSCAGYSAVLLAHRYTARPNVAASATLPAWCPRVASHRGGTGQPGNGAVQGRGGRVIPQRDVAVPATALYTLPAGQWQSPRWNRRGLSPALHDRRHCARAPTAQLAHVAVRESIGREAEPHGVRESTTRSAPTPSCPPHAFNDTLRRSAHLSTPSLPLTPPSNPIYIRP